MNIHFFNWIVSSFLGTFILCSPMSAAVQEAPSESVKQESTDVDDLRRDMKPERELMRQGRNGPAARGGDRATSGRRGFARLNNPSENDLELFLEVVGELSPSGRDSLVELRANDAEAFRKAVVQRGRRIWNLVQLRVTNRDLYDLKIAEMAIQRQLNMLASRYREAAARGAADEAADIRVELEKVAVEHVDLEMRVRGEELAAMAEALEKLRQELLSAANGRADRVKALLEEVTTPRSAADDDAQDAPRRGLLREFSGTNSEPGPDSSPSNEAESPAGR